MSIAAYVCILWGVLPGKRNDVVCNARYTTSSYIIFKLIVGWQRCGGRRSPLPPGGRLPGDLIAIHSPNSRPRMLCVVFTAAAKWRSTSPRKQPSTPAHPGPGPPRLLLPGITSRATRRSHPVSASAPWPHCCMLALRTRFGDIARLFGRFAKVMQVLRMQQRHGVGRTHKVLQSHGIGRVRRPRPAQGNTADRSKERALPFRQSLLPLPDLPLHGMRQPLTLAFEPGVERAACVAFCIVALGGAAARAVSCLGSLANPLFQQLAMYIQIAHRPGGAANLLESAQPGAGRPLQSRAAGPASRSMASSIACSRREPVLTRCTASGPRPRCAARTAALKASATGSK